jgi:hypothetical protein
MSEAIAMNDLFDSPSALPLMQSLMATLADIDFAHSASFSASQGAQGTPH